MWTEFELNSSQTQKILRGCFCKVEVRKVYDQVEFSSTNSENHFALPSDYCQFPLPSRITANSDYPLFWVTKGLEIGRHLSELPSLKGRASASKKRPAICVTIIIPTRKLHQILSSKLGISPRLQKEGFCFQFRHCLPDFGECILCWLLRFGNHVEPASKFSTKRFQWTSQTCSIARCDSLGKLWIS